MRLKQIRLSGFKSFVELTKISFPSDMTAIVGPNGCGKSNVIDAVRWVLGESSARNLRGDSMTDVIFNGSTRRAAVSKASVELCFDNQQGRLQGALGQYNEVAVRREVTRDGQNTYFLNGNKCRKRDITDLFLGTGLGPRSYAIIEQGMISRLIESKPQELRIFIDEAAGVSKYKERRRETENKINNTQENLLRLDDLQSELSRQVEKLKTQAKAAERFRQLRDEQRQLRDLERLSQLNQIDAELEKLQQQLLQSEEVQAIVEARLVELEGQQLLLKHKEDDVREQQNSVTQRYFEQTNQIAQYEQELRHLRQSEQDSKLEYASLNERLNSTQSELQRYRDQFEQQQQRVEASSQAYELNDGLLAELDEVCDSQSEILQERQQAWRNLQQEYQQLQQNQQRLTQSIVNHQKMRERLEAVLLQHQQQLEQLLMETSPDLDALEERVAMTESTLIEVTAQEEETAERLAKAKQAQADNSELHQKLRQDQMTLKAKIDSLQQVVEKLSPNVSADLPLSEALHVEPGWELAVEKVLGEWLHADLLELRDLSSPFAVFPREAATADILGNYQSLSTKLSGPCVQFLTDKVLVAEDLEQALAMLEYLDLDQSVITPRGEWLGSNWQHLEPLEQQHSLLYLEAQRLESSEQLTELQQVLEDAQARLEGSKLQEQQIQLLLRDKKSLAEQLRRQLIEQQGELSLARQQYAQIAKQASHLNEQIRQTQQQIESDSLEEASLDEALAIAQQQSEALSSREVDARRQFESVQIERDSVKAQRDGLRHQLHQSQLTMQQAKADMNQSQLMVEREERQLAELQQAFTKLKDVAALTQEMERLQLAIEERVRQQLETQRRKQEFEQESGQLHQQQSDLMAQHKSYAAKLSEQQQVTQKFQLLQQEWQTRHKLLIEQINQEGESVSELRHRLPSPNPDFDYAKGLEALEMRIKRMGAVNLAAEAEYQEQNQRLVELSGQLVDLQEALAILQSAIAKIDRETRSKFRETFDKVNTDLQQLFPQVFGGGTAWLELTGDDLLDTGVTIMARPPGKKNSTISLLSGGEKALTALALVFAIFRLNPAPFCMLDEVDAPLDEVNVGRFADLVERMSETVQFIFISHNKVTMEKASQLAGVTMHEPGVSRLVAVDIAQAVAMAELH